MKRAMRQYCYISVHTICKIIEAHWPNPEFHPVLLSEPPQFVRPLTFQGVRGIPQSSWPTGQMLPTVVYYWLIVDVYSEKPRSNVSHKCSLGLGCDDLAVQLSELRSHHVHSTVPGQAHPRRVSRDAVGQIKGEYLDIMILSGQRTTTKVPFYTFLTHKIKNTLIR